MDMENSKETAPLNKKEVGSKKPPAGGGKSLPERSLSQKELEYMCDWGGKTTPSYVDNYIDPDLEV